MTWSIISFISKYAHECYTKKIISFAEFLHEIWFFIFDKNIWFLKEIIENIKSKALGGVLPTFKMVFKLRYGTINFLFDYCDMFL